MQHVVAMPDRFKHFVGIVGSPHDPRRECRYFSSGRCSDVSSVQSLKPTRCDVRTRTTFVDLEVLDQDVDDAPWHAVLDLEHRQRAVPQLPQPLIDGLEQVVRFVLLDDHVGVPDDPEDIRAAHLRSREQVLRVRANNILEKNERGRGRRERRRQRNEPRHHRRAS